MAQDVAAEKSASVSNYDNNSRGNSVPYAYPAHPTSLISESIGAMVAVMIGQRSDNVYGFSLD